MQMATTTPRRSTASPKPPRTEQQPKSPIKPPPATARRRSWKPPEPDAATKKAPPSPPPPPESPPGDPPGDEEATEEKGSHEFDDKEVDPAAEDKAIDQIHQSPASGDPPAEDPPDWDPPPELDPVLEKSGRAEEEEESYTQGSVPGGEKRMQRIVDLVMWRDMSRSALVFGMGTFFFVSSSYTRDLNLSLISVGSYLGLFYLAGIFLLNSVLRRGDVDFGESKESWLVGEEEALWLIRMLLPYVNEILTKLKALFSGDPSTTMKMAMLLFALARCGGSITVLTLGKLAFFGMFTIPRFCASYSGQISRYGTFWLERFRDAWESCTHKKAAAAATFTIFWNLSSTPARIWSVFMLAVTLRYYQQRVPEGWFCTTDDGMEEDHLDNSQQLEGCKDDEGEEEKPPRKGKVAGTTTVKIAAQGPRQRLRSGPPTRLEMMGPKERKKG